MIYINVPKQLTTFRLFNLIYASKPPYQANSKGALLFFHLSFVYIILHWQIAYSCIYNDDDDDDNNNNSNNNLV